MRSTIIAPAVVYGHGLGIPNVLDGDDGVHLVGDGTQHWATVRADGRHARETLGWTPTRPTLAEQFASGYATADVGD